MISALEVDVRPMLRNGGEPFGVIMDAVNHLESGQSLKLYATFRPEPLLKLMATRGFECHAVPLDGGDWQVTFTPSSESAVLPSTAEDPNTWSDPLHYLDCTGLDAPAPMVRILGQLEEMLEADVLFALLDREPLLLFPELRSRGHAWVGDFDETGDAYRLMVRAGRLTDKGRD